MRVILDPQETLRPRADGTYTEFSEVNNPVELVDSYSEANQNTDLDLTCVHPGVGCISAVGHSFTVPLNGNKRITRARFYLRKVGAPVGSLIARLYAEAGDVPVGGALASSGVVGMAGLGLAFALWNFNFVGANRFEMVAGTKYCIVVEAFTATVLNAANRVEVGIDSTAPTHPGQTCYYWGGWFTAAGFDTCFYVYGFDARHWFAVDEAVSDGDGSYIRTDPNSGVPQRDTFLLPNTGIDPADTINWVRVYMNVRSESGTNRASARTMVRTHGTDYWGVGYLVPSVYTLYNDQYATNPFTGSAWTVAELNALECGVRGSSGAGCFMCFIIFYYPLRCTQSYVVIDYTVVIPPVPEVSRAEWPWYLNFARRLLSKCLDFTSETYAQEKESLKQEFILRGLDEAVLDQLIPIIESKCAQIRAIGG